MIRKYYLLLIGILPLLILAAACDSLGDLTGESAVTPTPEPTPQNATPVPLFTVEPGNTVTETRPVSQLRVWVPPEFGAEGQPSAELLAAQINAFNALYPELEILVESKPFDGTGGILTYIRTGRTTAPSILPDLVALPAARLSDSAVRDVVFPIDGFLGSDALTDVFPASAAQVQYDGRLFGFPFALTDLTNLVYSTEVITTSVPLNWEQFISDTEHTLALPADSAEGAWFGLQIYLAYGGTLVNEAGQAALELDPLVETLVDISEGKANLRGSEQLTSLDQAWQVYQLGNSNFVWTRSGFLLGQLPAGEQEPGSPGGGTAFTAVPGPISALRPLVNSWAWSVTTSEPARQALATELLLYLTNEASMTEWAALGIWLPTRRSVMSIFAQDRPYYRFAMNQMETAEPVPAEVNSRILTAMGDAVFRVLATGDPPADIARDAVLAVQQ